MSGELVALAIRLPPHDRELVLRASRGEGGIDVVGRYALVVEACALLHLDDEAWIERGEERPATESLSRTCDAIVVTSGPVQGWSRRTGVAGLEEARRSLTAIAALSRPVDATTQPELWRYRRRREQIDVSFRVLREEVLGARLAIVVSASWAARR